MKKHQRFIDSPGMVMSVVAFLCIGSALLLTFFADAPTWLLILTWVVNIGFVVFAAWAITLISKEVKQVEDLVEESKAILCDQEKALQEYQIQIKRIVKILPGIKMIMNKKYSDVAPQITPTIPGFYWIKPPEGDTFVANVTSFADPEMHVDLNEQWQLYVSLPTYDEKITVEDAVETGYAFAGPLVVQAHWEGDKNPDETSCLQLVNSYMRMDMETMVAVMRQYAESAVADLSDNKADDALHRLQYALNTLKSLEDAYKKRYNAKMRDLAHWCEPEQDDE